jgi:hypothetical protein
MKIFNLLLLILVLIPTIASSTTMNEARQGALDFGRSYKDSGNSIITEGNKQSTPGYVTDNPEQTKYYSGADMSGDIEHKVANSDEGELMTESLPNRPDVEVNFDDPFLQYAREIETNPEAANEVIEMFDGNYEQCTPIIGTVTDVETRTCDFYEERDGGSCLVNQIVEVDAIHNYGCNKTRNVRDKTCNKTLDVTCEEYSYDFPHTTYNSIPGFSYSNFSLKYRTPNRLGQSCGGYNYYWRFDLYSADQVEEFKFLWGQADDRTLIYINGNLVHNYPSHGCEWSRTYHSAPNIDLKPYLKVGNNELRIRIIVGGRGEGRGEFRLKYKECSKLVEDWQEVCP